MRKMASLFAAVALVSLPWTVAGAAPGDGRSYVAGRFMLALDGAEVGFVRSAEGGATSAEVVEVTLGESLVTKKHIGNPKFEDFSVQAGLDLAPSFYEWISAMLERAPIRKDGAIVAADFRRQVVSSHDFQNALISEVAFPALDGAAKDPAYMTVKFAPESSEVKGADGSTIQGEVKPQGQKTWHPANFRFTLGDLPTKRVVKIDSFTVKQGIARFASGDARVAMLEPTKLEIPNLRITFSRLDLQPWLDWFEEFVIQGDNGDAKELTGSIEYLDPSRKVVLAHIDLSHVGIFRLDTLPPGALDSAESVQRVTVELYVEEMKFVHGK